MPARWSGVVMGRVSVRAFPPGYGPALLAAGAAVLGVALDAAGAYTRWGYLSPPWALRLVPLAVACAALLFRRRAPLAGLALAVPAVAADLVLGPSLAVVVIFTEELYTATAHGPDRAVRWLLWAGGLAVAGLATAVLGLSGQPGDALLAAVFAALVLVWPAVGGVTIRQYRDRLAVERRYAAQVARLAALDRRDLVLAERTRMARELHDLVANHLSAIAVQSAAALSRDDPSTSLRALGVIRDNSVRGLTEMRRMIELLRDGDAGPDEPLTTSPGLDELEPLLERARRAGLAAALEVTGEPRPLPAAVDLAAYRIVRESLANTRAHAGAVAVCVRLEYRPGCLAVTVDNPLPATAPVGTAGAGGTGLVRMGERAALLGGTFTAGPDGDRWRVRADLPC